MESTKYEPLSIEMKWYARWEKNGYFQPSMNRQDTPFSILLPPPNVTGVLHMGHAFNQTIMDALVRFHRMKGENVCWIPGLDHSGIATQIVVERQLASEGMTRYDLGREAFLDRVWDWKNNSGGTMKEQMKKLGCSADWTREYFTMDDTRAKIVTEAFVRLYEQGLIYRGKRLVNWDPVLKTAISDLEVENVEEQGFMWSIKYLLKDNPDEFLVIATTRPETLLGDVAIAVHPEDERYQKWIGKEVIIPLTGRTVPVIADEYVDKDFGTGCVKITPAHDFNDYLVGQRNQMPLINIFDLQANVLREAEIYSYDTNIQVGSIVLPEQFHNLDRFEARKKIVEELSDKQLLVNTKPHTLMIPRGDRTGTVIEPMLTDQWFVSMDKIPHNSDSFLSLGDQARRAVDSKEVSFIPENWVNTYNQWMKELQDWCISRQLWWGHQIPAWYDEDGNIFVARSQDEAMLQAGTKNIKRDEDVLDTWFSSALVPFAALGWPEDNDEMEVFLPSTVLVTGHEIIFFWVARMIMMTTHFTGKIPFRKVYIHGIVRDHEGKKMSKSEGNVIDPVDIIEGVSLQDLLRKRTTGLRQPEKAEDIKKATQKLFPNHIEAYGADALRYTMASYASLGRSVNFDLKRCEGYRNFCNKIWNAARFVLMNVENQDCGQKKDTNFEYSFVDQWILGRLEEVKIAVTQAFETYRIDLVAKILYEFLWNEYCDWYLELTKVQLRDEREVVQITTRKVLLEVLEVALRLLHPIMPFITEEIWQSIAPLTSAKQQDSIIISSWPLFHQENVDLDCVRKMALLKELVNSIRNLKVAMGLKTGVKPPLLIEDKASQLKNIIPYLPMIARLSQVELLQQLPEHLELPVGMIAGDIKFILKVEIDKAAETQRLNQEIVKLTKAREKIENKLSKPGYQEKAPKHLVEKDKIELNSLLNHIRDIQEQLDQLQR
ncbi:MAG: valine--tRNA ligase [Neisseriaceae bacterium]|nr:MAG: valine--tRNA ligase [Neisseriaceae bacterium]